MTVGQYFGIDFIKVKMLPLEILLSCFLPITHNKQQSFLIQKKISSMVVLPAIKSNHRFVFCPRHACFGAASHINGVCTAASSSICNIVVVGCFSNFQTFQGEKKTF